MKISKNECMTCGKSYSHKQGLSRHKSTAHSGKKHVCKPCRKTFNRRDNYLRHIKSQRCQQRRDSSTDIDENVEIKLYKCNVKALNGTIETHNIETKGLNQFDCISIFDPMTFMNSQYDNVNDIIKQKVRDSGGIKWYMSMKMRMSRTNGELQETAEPYFRGKCQTSLKVEDIDVGLKESIDKMNTAFSNYQCRGSNWTADKVIDLTINMARYRPFRGSSYIQLPIKLKSKKAIINIKNNDNKCFVWSILAGLHPAQKDAQRTSKYKKYFKTLNTDGIEFPVEMRDIPRFEKQNNVSINIFGYKNNEIFPLHITNLRSQPLVNLMIITKRKKSHFCYIKNLNRLLGDQKSDGHKHFYCLYCLQGFTQERILNNHAPYCQSHGIQKIDLPKEADKWLYYKDIRKQLKVPFIIYADFECLLVPIVGCQNNYTKSSTSKITKHTPCGFAYKVVGPTLETSKKIVVYRGADAADKFVEYMIKEQEEIEQKFQQHKYLKMTPGDKKSYRKATECHICQGKLSHDSIKVRDHCHITGKFRGAAHKECNINYRLTGRIPVVFHNLSGYHSHLIIQAIGKVNKKLKCIPNNMEKYMSFSMGCMDFIDSHLFMPSSLENLVENLAKDSPSKFRHMTMHFTEKKMHLFLRKQVYPYEYFDSTSKFTESQLPPIEAFYNSLSNEGISELDYDHAQQVWQQFNMQSLGDYHDLYVAADALALADVFENFRDICLNYYELDAAHFPTLPGLAWQAALKMTRVKLELLTDIDMHLFVEKGLRGGTSMISQRHAKANNKDVPNYDKNKPNNFVMYLDANNLYGWAMSQALPVEGFRWLDEFEKGNLDVNGIKDDSENGYIFEVDLEYPEELHDNHNEYPLAPEKVKVTEAMLSPYAKKLLEDLKISVTSTDKLIPNLYQKEKYVVHYRNLKLYLSLGMKLIKTHRVMVFKQEQWLKKYIGFNTAKRQMAKNSFEKDFFKSMNNVVFGKTMENIRKRTDIKLVNNQSKARKLINKPTFNAFKTFNNDLVAVHMLKPRLYLNKPIYLGFTILDLSKELMYDFHYNKIKKKYGTKAKLLFTDTDSLCYSFETDDIYQDMIKNKDWFDTSDYDPKHPLHSTLNKKVLGKMKDETNGVPIQEFVGLKSKMYSLIYEENGNLKGKKTAAGIKKSVTKLHTRHEHYRQCLFNKEIHTSTSTQIRSYDHQLYNISINKRGLSPFDDKRYILDDGISSYAYGHCNLRKYTVRRN